MGRTVEFCALAVPESHNLLKTSSDFSKTNSESASIAEDSPLRMKMKESLFVTSEQVLDTSE